MKARGGVPARGNKKAQVGSTITWMVAFTVIFFVLVIYLFGVGIMAGGKAFESQASYSADWDSDSLAGQRRFIVLLNSEVEFMGKKMTLRDAISESMSIYARDDIFSKLNVKSLDNLADGGRYNRQRLVIGAFSSEEEGKAMWDIIEQQEKDLEIVLEEKLNDGSCYAYLFESPLYSVAYFNGEKAGHNIILDKSLVKSLIVFFENGKEFSVSLYVSKLEEGCNEK